MLSYRSDLKSKARSNRKNMNKPEAKLWYEVLARKQMGGFRFLRQKPIDQYIVDFYCHELSLIIEVDGESHNEQVEYDRERTSSLEKLGFKIIRYSNWDIMKNIDGVATDIENAIKKIELRRKPL